MVTIRVLRVFADENAGYGNPLGVIENGAEIHRAAERIALAAALGYSETVFVDEVATASVRMYSGLREVAFAGHAAVGVAWLLEQQTGDVPAVLSIGERHVAAWRDGTHIWVRSPLAHAPAWWHERVESVAALEQLSGPVSALQDMTQLWAWIDEPAGVMRVRTFAGRAGIPEDEACGSGAMRLAAAFGRPLVLHHGRGSIIHARPGPPGHADVGGLVAEDDSRHL